MPKILKKVSTGIYRDAHGVRAVVDIAAGRQEKRFDRDHPLKAIKRWRNETKTKLERLHPQRRAGALGHGTFSAAVRTYLKTLAIASWKSRRSELRAWEKRFGKVKRRRVGEDHVKKAIKAWTDAGVPPKTILNRIRALTAMYHALDGADAWTPADTITPPKIQRKNPAYVSPARIVAVEGRLREQETTDGLDPTWRARYMVLAASGERPVFLKRARPGDVDLARRVWDIGAAKDGNPILLPLNEEMVAAWERFLEVDAWGDFDVTEYAKIVRAAGWPAHVRPYATKHSLSQDLADQGVDLETIRDWHGHTETQTTRIYTGAMRKKLREASAALDGRLGWKPSVAYRVAADLGSEDTKPSKLEIEQALAVLRRAAILGS